MGKLEELKNLKSLLDQGAITETEFQSLKNKVLLDDKGIITSNSVIESSESINAEIDENKVILSSPKLEKPLIKKIKSEDDRVGGEVRIHLKSFKDSFNNLINPPDIKFLHINHMSDYEIELLKPFIRLKQINAPEEFTNDEIEIGNRLFSSSELDKINAERKGMNYRKEIIIATFLAVVSGVLLYILPCLVVFSVGLGWIMSLIMAISILRKSDATRLDRNYAYVVLGLVVIVLIIYFVRSNAMFGS